MGGRISHQVGEIMVQKNNDKKINKNKQTVFSKRRLVPLMGDTESAHCAEFHCTDTDDEGGI